MATPTNDAYTQKLDILLRTGNIQAGSAPSQVVLDFLTNRLSDTALSLGSSSVVTAASPTSVATGLTATYNGTPTRGLFKVSVPKELFVAAATTQALDICTLPAKGRVVGAWLDVTTKLAGLSSTITLMLGDETDDNSMILAADVKTAAVTLGLVDADLGVGLALGTSVNGGYIPSWTAAKKIQLKLTSGSGNIGNGTVTNLTTGVMVVYVLLENIL